MKGILYAMLITLFVTGCSKPKVKITFHKSPSDADKVVSDVKSILTNHGMRAWNHEWIVSKILTLRIDTEKTNEQFKEATSKIFDPMLWKPGKTSELRIQITEKSNNVLRLLELQENKLYTVTLHWDDADFGIFEILPDSHRQGGVSVNYNCSVRVPATGDIPKLTYWYTLDNQDEANNTENAGGILKFFQTINELNPAASYTATLSDYHKDYAPWSKVEFVNRAHSRPDNTSNGEKASPKEVVLKDALFVFAPCQSNQRYTDIPREYAFNVPPCPEFTNETCAKKIRELAKGDFYGVTGYEISGNVEKYSATW